MGKTAMLRIYATIVCALLSLTETRNCGNVIEPFYQDQDPRRFVLYGVSEDLARIRLITRSYCGCRGGEKVMLLLMKLELELVPVRFFDRSVGHTFSCSSCHN